MARSSLGLLCLALPAHALAELEDKKADDPIVAEIAYTGEVWRVARGGLAKGTRYLDNLDLTLAADMAHYGIPGGDLFFYGLVNNHTELSADLIGDLQVISNIDSGRAYRLFEAWYQHQFDRARVKLGLIDLNSEFDVIETGALFVGSSHGIGPDFSQTGEGGPSIFPSTSPAVVIEVQPSDRLRLLAGAFDAVPNNPDRLARHRISLGEGALLVAEANYIGPGEIRMALGAYTYTSRFDPLLPTPVGPVGGNTGVYGIVEAPLTDRLSGWLRVGTADGTINAISYYSGAGLVLNAPLPGRADDQLGLAIGTAWIGGDQKRLTLLEGGRPTNTEIEMELTYRFQATDFLAIQPDLKLVLHPGGVRDIRNAVVIGLRFEIGMKLF